MAELKKLQENGTDIYPITLEDVVFDTNGNSISTKYQTKTDNTLNTTNKTIVGAINELFQSGANAKQNLVDTLVAKGISASTSMTFDELINLINNLDKDGTDLPEWLKKTIWLRAKDSSYYIALSASCVVDKNIYIIGGYVNTVSSTSATESQYFYYYNTSTNEYMSMTNMLSRRYCLTASSVGTCIYAIGGSYDGLHDENECFDTSNVDNGWVTKTAMPTKRAKLTSSVVNNKIYCIGGDAFKTSTTATISDINECYDPSTDTWTTKTVMLTKRDCLTSSVVDNKIYCIGGEPSSNNNKRINECYDPSTDTWSSKTDMPTDRISLVSSTVNNKIYCIGGNNSSVIYDINEEYNPFTDTWTTKANIETPLNKANAEVVNNCIYIIGGKDDNSYYLNTNYCYMPNNDN